MLHQRPVDLQGGGRRAASTAWVAITVTASAKKSSQASQQVGQGRLCPLDHGGEHRLFADVHVEEQ